MSYARFGWGGSDVYIYLDVGGFLCCCGCSLDNDGWRYYSTNDLIEHLNKHKQAGHCVLDETIEALLADKEENDTWITNYNPVEEKRKRDEANAMVEEIRRIAKEELGYVHPGYEKFNAEEYNKAYKKAQEIYESRQVESDNQSSAS